MRLIDFLRRFSPFAGKNPSARNRPVPPVDSRLPPEVPFSATEVLEKLPIGVFAIYPNGGLIYGNPALARLLGYPTTSDIPKDPTGLYFDPQDRVNWRSRVDAEGMVLGNTLRMRRADGSGVWVEMSIFGVSGPDGKPLYYEGALIDISEREQAQAALQLTAAALRHSESRYLGLFENSPVALWEEDFSAVKVYIDELKARGVTDFEAFFAATPEAVSECLARVRVEDVNQTTLKLYHAASKEELLSGLPTILGPATLSIFTEEMLVIARGETIFESEGQNNNLDGEVLDIFLRWSVAPGFEDTYGKVFVSTIDMTERKRAERRERRRAERSAALAQISQSIMASGLQSEAIYEVIAARMAELLGDACMLGILAEERSSGGEPPGRANTAAGGKTPSAERPIFFEKLVFRHADHEAQTALANAFQGRPGEAGEAILRQVAATGVSVYLPEVSSAQLTGLAPSGNPTNLEKIPPLRSLIVAPLGPPGAVIGVLAAMRSREGDPYTPEDLAFVNDLAGFAAMTILNAQLHTLALRQAQYDSMTGAHNRSYFIRLAEIEFSRSQRYGCPLSAVMIDLDHFKVINDTYGHAAGDHVLVEMVRHCATALRACDLFGRYGGEEFMILLPETGLDGAIALAERVRRCVDEHQFVHENLSIHLTISLGVATINAMTPTLSTLLAQADTALYAAKHSGRNRIAH